MRVLITGGASGLGESITRRIAREPLNTVYFTYNESEASAKRIESEFPNVSSCKCDFKNKAETDALSERLGGFDLDAIINNAYSGGFINAHFHKTSTSDFLTDFTNNIMPTVTLTQSAIKCFRKKKQGKIITVLTAALINKPPIGSSVYIATKAYLQQLTKIWAVENAKFNITSNSVSPAFMRTAMTSHMDERVVEQIMENSPLGKLLTTEEVAESIFLLLNAPAQINGVNLIINGAANVL